MTLVTQDMVDFMANEARSYARCFDKACKEVADTYKDGFEADTRGWSRARGQKNATERLLVIIEAYKGKEVSDVMALINSERERLTQKRASMIKRNARDFAREGGPHYSSCSSFNEISYVGGQIEAYTELARYLEKS